VARIREKTIRTPTRSIFEIKSCDWRTAL